MTLTAIAAAPVSKPSPRVAKPPRQNNFAQSFAQIVAVFMRDPRFRTLSVADLEWLVLPPVMVGQFGLAHAPAASLQVKADKKPKAQPGAPIVPVAVALWARVSPQVDKALSENLDKPIRLRAADWTSGDNIWLIALAGDQRALPRFLAELNAKEFKGRQVKMRKRGPDGKVVIRTIAEPL